MGMQYTRSKVEDILTRLNNRMHYQRVMHTVQRDQDHITTVLITADYINTQIEGKRFDWEGWSYELPVLHPTTWVFPDDTRKFEQEVPLC